MLVLAGLLYLPGLAQQPFYTKGEPREALVVWEMMHGGGLLLPLRNGVEIPSKPPLFHWLGASVAIVTGGVSELAVRLPSALLAITAVVAVYWFGATIGRIRSGWIAAVALATSFEWLRAARVARVDMTLTFFLFGALLCFAVMTRSRVTRPRLAIFYACLALATLGKGPVGVALPALVIVLYAATSEGAAGASCPGEAATAQPEGVQSATAAAAGGLGSLGKSIARRLRERAAHVRAVVAPLEPVKGLLFVAAVAGSWYVAALVLGGESFFVKQILKENVLRVLDPERLDSGHEHGLLYFVPNFVAGALPWSLLLPAIAWWLVRLRPLDATTRLLVVWFVTVIGFFSLSASKRSVYILSAYPAAALLLGHVLGPGPDGVAQRRVAGYGVIAGAFVLALVALLALVIAAGIPIDRVIEPRLHATDRAGVTIAILALRASRWRTAGAAIVLLLGVLVAALSARGAHWLRATAALGAAMLALGFGVLAPIDRGLAESRTLKSFSSEVLARVGDEPLAFYRRTFDYGLIYYTGRHIPHYRGRLDRPRRSRPGGRAGGGRASHRAEQPRFILMWEEEAARLGSHVQVLARSRGTGPKGRSPMVLAARAEP